MPQHLQPNGKQVRGFEGEKDLVHPGGEPSAGDARITARPARGLAVEAASLAIAKMICEDWADDEKATPEDYAKDIQKHIIWCWDGYELAKRLENRCYWAGVNAQLVEILDSASGVLDSEHAKLVKAWVAENNIGFPFTVGQSVRIHKGVGVVVETPDYARAEARVHVRTPEQHDRQAWVVNYEDAVPLSDGATTRQASDADDATRSPTGGAEG